MKDKRWTILLVLFIARTSLAFQVQSVASVSNFLADDLQLDLSDIGTLVGLVMLPGVIFSLPSGFIGGWLSDKQFVLTGLLLMVVGGLILAGTDSYSWMAAGRIISGVGIVLNGVYLAKMVTDWFAGREIATAMSILITSWPFGFALGQAFQPQMAEQWGWRVVPLVTSFVCLLCAVLIWVVYYAPDRESAGNSRVSPQVKRLSLPVMTLVLLSGLIWSLLNVGYLVYLSFTPVSLVESGESIISANRVSSLASWAMLLSIPAVGWLADRTGKSNLLLFAGTLVSIASLALLPGTENPALLCLLFGLLGLAPAGIVMALPARILAPNERAFAMGIFFTVYYIGMTVGPGIAGSLADYYTSADAALYFASGLFLMMAFCHLAFRAIQAKHLLPHPTN